jgi:hypothetical protein
LLADDADAQVLASVGAIHRITFGYKFTHGVCDDYLQKLDPDYPAEINSKKLRAELEQARRQFLEAAEIFLMLQKRCLPGYPNLIVVSGFNARRMRVSVRLTSI